MATHRRTATFDAVLVHMDEPQLITLIANKTRVVAVAIPHENSQASMFLATTVSEKDWRRYLAGTADLRYLFTIPTVRTAYTFDLQTMREQKVKMLPWPDGDIDERFLPSPRFFSSNHTEDYTEEERPTDSETLIIDGDWELPDLGQFQQKFSDIYTFVISTDNWISPDISHEKRRKIQQAFLHRPFQGGFSYVHMFADLSASIASRDQLNLSRINYASPGQVEIFGREDVFKDVHAIITNFIARRDELIPAYKNIYQYLSSNNYLKMSGESYGRGDPTEARIERSARGLADAMLAPDYDVVSKMAGGNVLVSAKIVLAFYRRLSDAAMYFAQGRIAYLE